MALIDHLQELGSQLGLPASDIRLDNQGRCTLTVLGTHQLTLEESPDGSTLLMSALLCRYPDETSRLALFDLLMEAHAYGLGTDDAYFGASQAMGAVFLFKRRPLEGLSFDDFNRAVASFASVYAYWKNQFDSGNLSAPSTHTASTPQGLPLGQMA